MDNALLGLDTQEKDVEPFTANEFFAVDDGFAGRDARELEDVELSVFTHEEPQETLTGID